MSGTSARMNYNNYDSMKNDFLSSDSKVQTLVYLEELLDRTATQDEINMTISHMLNKVTSGNVRFFQQHRGDLNEARKAIAHNVARHISTMRARNRVPVRQYDNEFSSEDEERSDPDEPIQDLLKDEIYSTSETNATRTRLDLDWGADRYQKQKPINFDSLPLSHCRAFMGWRDGYDLVSALNPTALVRSYPILTLDTRNRGLSDENASSRRTMTWAFYNNSRISQGAVNGLGTIRDIVGIECGTIYFPNVEDQAFTEYRQITMFIHEFSEQASIINDKVRYHFLFNAESIVGDSGTERLKLTPAFKDSAETKFDRPITTLNTLTISFGCPGERITFSHDRDLSPTSVSAANPAVFTTSITHGLSNGDLVYLENFTTDDPSGDASLITLANREKGHVIQSVTATTFEIATIDTSAVTGQTVGTIIFGSQRFFIPLKFRYIGGKRYDE